MQYVKVTLTDKEYKHLFTQGANAIYDFGKQHLGFGINSDPVGYYGIHLREDKETGEKYVLIDLADDFNYLQEAEEY